jgi:hypothetical protein
VELSEKRNLKLPIFYSAMDKGQRGKVLMDKEKTRDGKEKDKRKTRDE